MLSENSTGINRLIFDRICRICDEIIIHDSEYKELGKIPSELIRQLMAKLPKEDRELLDRYSSGNNQQQNRQDEILYTRGLFDGIWLCKWIERIGRGEQEV